MWQASPIRSRRSGKDRRASRDVRALHTPGAKAARASTGRSRSFRPAPPLPSSSAAAGRAAPRPSAFAQADRETVLGPVARRRGGGHPPALRRLDEQVARAARARGARTGASPPAPAPARAPNASGATGRGAAASAASTAAAYGDAPSGQRQRQLRLGRQAQFLADGVVGEERQRDRLRRIARRDLERDDDAASRSRTPRRRRIPGSASAPETSASTSATLSEPEKSKVGGRPHRPDRASR